MRNKEVPLAKRTSARRHFLKLAGAGAASLACAGGGLGDRSAVAAEAKTAAQAIQEKPFKLGLASYTFVKLDLDKTLEMTKRAGLERICLKSAHLPLDAKPAEIAAAVEKVKKAGLVLDGCGVVDMKDEAQIKQAFEYAKAAGMKKIIAAPTPQVLPLVNEKVRQYDIQVCIHNHGPGDKNFPTPQSVYEKIQGLDKRIGLCLDIGHTVRFGIDLIDATERCADRLLDVHIKDVTEATAAGRGVVVGRGIIDIPRFLRTLIKIKYSGTVAFEYEEKIADKLPGLAESVGFTRGVLATI